MQARWRVTCVLATLVLVSFGALQVSHAQDQDQRIALAMPDLSWLAGHWQGKLGSADIEEIWTAPAGGGMMGMFRLVRGDKTVMYELCAIEPAADGPKLVMRHFGPGLAARESEPMTFACLRQDTQAVTFVRESSGGVRDELTYRCPAADKLEVTLHKAQGDKKSTVVFPFERKR